LLAGDGALRTRQTVTVSVVADANTTTRISGLVKNTLDLNGTVVIVSADVQTVNQRYRKRASHAWHEPHCRDE
jgi:hypothetical protein